jgi:DmsE family decaheme c-type cytochrome
MIKFSPFKMAAVLAVVCVFGTAFSAGAAEPAAAGAAAEQAAPAYSRKGADTCLTCHDDESLAAIFRTKHGAPNDPRSPFGHGQLQCEACHGPGDAHARGKGKSRPDMLNFGKGSATPVAKQNSMCLACHQKDASHWTVGAHAANDVGCADCHDSHAKQDPMKSAATQAETCGTCHQSQVSAQHMPYRHPTAEGKMECTSCHQPHGSTNPAMLTKATSVETCTSCHSDLRGPFAWEHQPVTEDCAICHAPHGSTNPSMLKARGPFQCQSCHQASGHPSLAYGSNNLPGRGTPSVYVVAGNCLNCHSQVHGSNHPSGAKLMR